MSKFQVFSIRDVKAEAFSQSPFFFRSIGEAQRVFGDEVKNPESQLGKHPEDFQLFHIGEYDQTTGVLTPFAVLQPISYGTDFIVKN